MQIAYRKKLGLKIADIYFFDDERIIFDQKPDIIFYLQMTYKMKNAIDFYTLHIDLSQDENALFSEINKSTRHNINKAMNMDNLQYYFFTPSIDDIFEFSDYFKVLAKRKKIAKCSISRLKALAEANSLIFSKIFDENGNILCFHAYAVDEKRARILYTVSSFRESNDNQYRTMVATANKYMHWKDILNFKKQGFLIYDLGGIVVSDKDSIDQQNITYFKKSFGGKVVQECNLIEGVSLIGKVLLKFYNLVNLK